MIDQLLAKALSTSSEEEAMSCLRMARKKNAGKTTNVNVEGAGFPSKSTGEYNGRSAKYWYDKALGLYHTNQRYELDYLVAQRALKRQTEAVAALRVQVGVWKLFNFISLLAAVGMFGFILF